MTNAPQSFHYRATTIRTRIQPGFLLHANGKICIRWRLVLYLPSYPIRSRDTRPVSWIRAARKAFDSFAQEPQNAILRALTVAAEGRKADVAKPLKGFGSGTFEVAIKHRTDAYRAVYAVRFRERIWVLHAFKKKAGQGIKTSKKDIDLIRERLKRLKKELQQ